jgi:hypothetical protein
VTSKHREQDVVTGITPVVTVGIKFGVQGWQAWGWDADYLQELRVRCLQ